MTSIIISINVLYGFTLGWLLAHYWGRIHWEWASLAVALTLLLILIEMGLGL